MRSANTHTSSSPPVLSPGEFHRFKDFFYRKTGICFEENKRYFVEKRLLERMQRTGHEDFRGYFTFLRFEAHGKELQELTNLLTVNETYFFREEYQLRCMVDNVMDEIAKGTRGTQPIRIWSMPCSTGEEPYSIAIYLLEHWPKINSVDVEIIATDIDTNVLERCKEGVYSKRSIQNLPKHLLSKYFTKLSSGEYQLGKHLRQAVSFRRANLFEPGLHHAYSGIDLIFCRNLLIYFDDNSRRAAAQTFYDALNPGGFIFLGHSESMSRICSLYQVRQFSETLAYQKPR